MPRLALIVVDEEHDPSYKQHEGFRYSARDVALVRARMADIPVVLGSATPALETLANVQRGKYQRSVIGERAGAAQAPRVECVDLRGQELVAGLGPQLRAAIAEHVARGEQVLLFLNRRGYSPLLICRQCGEPRRCAHCDAYLVYHKDGDVVRCHHCEREWSRTRPPGCCATPDVALLGLGTERLEEAIATLYPQARVCRIDRDSARQRDALRELLARVYDRQVDIVIGTQMLAKGLDFSGVTLVGVIDTDSRLYSLDFRAEERLAQLLVQVAGRAGRATLPGRVMVQTHQPRHPVLRQVIERGYDDYAQTALAARRAAGLPPYAAMAIVRAESRTQHVALAYLGEARRQLRTHTGSALDISQPLPALLERRAGRYRALLVVRAQQRLDLGAVLQRELAFLDAHARETGVRFAIDVDPQDTL